MIEKENESMFQMLFRKYDVNSVDVMQAWRATNTVTEDVNIFLNTLGEYEVWINDDFHASYDTFYEAQRYAEFAATFEVNILNWTQESQK
jgi:hypothetical protein